MKYVIDFMLLIKFKSLYENKFNYIDVPYVVEDKFNMETLPIKDGRGLLSHTPGLSYVGSAEQSFIKLISEKKLNLNNNYQTITLCSRDEKSLSHTHLLNFIKLELISFNMSPIEMAKYVLAIYKKHDKRDYVITPTGDSEFDITLNGLELGSYGVRVLSNGFSYTYGTGLALPRFTTEN